MATENNASKSPFAAMVSAVAQVDLPLSQFLPHSQLIVAAHTVERPMFPAVDFHNHLDDEDPGEVLRIMDASGIERIVNITMRAGADGRAQLSRFQRYAPDRFSGIGWMDWNGVGDNNFIPRTLDMFETLAEQGICGIKFWKDLGLSVRDHRGKLLAIDDDGLAPLFEKLAELKMFAMFHTADPDAFFLPIDAHNERYEELAAHTEWSIQNSPVSKPSLLTQRDNVIARHPQTTFVCAHLGESGENLERASALLERCSNAYLDISARVSELGRQPFSARRFMLRHADRILFGTDLPPCVDMYRLYYRILETEDEYFEYPSHASRQGRWNVYGLNLPGDVLEKLYRTNALHILGPRL